ncbi:general transcription factor 3C polypeptide 2 isoform X4 [Aphelocoma coerulescens]|uniref:general transcription factor 3C polypeptide 2 isoform X4 n=1 Tax=Aphelocoma coerulescens TaxID=39617 RepID=UPI003604C6D4
MASSAARGPPCRERSLRERPGRRSGSAGRSRSRSGEREGEQRVLREGLPAGDLDCEDEREAAKSPKKPVRPQVSPGGAVEGRGESSANGAVPSPGAAGKRGRKGKAEVLLLELSQAPEPIRMQKVLGSSEEGDGLETPRGGRPKRKAAKVALLYLQELAEELMSACQPPAPAEGAPELEPEHVQRKRRSRRRKEEDTDSDDPTRDADFVPSQEVLRAEEEEEEEEGSDTLLSEASEPELEAPRGHSGRTAATGRSKPQCRGLAPNGFHNSIMAPVEKSSSLTCSLREQKHSQWEFPDWIPVAHRWMCLSDSSPNKARLAYAIAADYGCVWDMKFCPSGAWEPPTTARTHPQMSRLGLLAAAFSDGRVVVYALPHPGALHHAKTTQVKDGSLHKHLICKVQCIATLQVGSIQAGNASECGQCFSLSWMPSKPHHHLAAGFYDGTVAVWNLLTKSLLQCVQQPDASLKLYPFQCFLAHDHAVRSIEWCKADSNFLVTVGSDRKIKFWDLRRLYEPINSIKRFLSTEVAWLLPYNGITVAQDNCYASYGLCGIHYIDAGYLGFKAYFVAPRKGTVWSISGSDWLNTVAAGDITGELVAAVLPDLAVNPLNVKRSSDRRFPVYKADLLPCSPDGPEGTEQALPRTHRYSEMIARSYIRFQDTDLRSFQNFPSREPMRRMHMQELKAELSLDRLQLEALHKVRFSPNLDSQGWLVSGGQAGIVRVHCLAGLASSVGHQLLPECRARFSFLYGDTSSSPGPPEGSLLPAE